MRPEDRRQSVKEARLSLMVAVVGDWAPSRLYGHSLRRRSGNPMHGGNRNRRGRDRIHRSTANDRRLVAAENLMSDDDVLVVVAEIGLSGCG